MNTGLLSGLFFVSLLIAAPGCGLPQTELEIHVDLLGTWSNATPNVTNTLEYQPDGSFRATATIATPTSGAQAGCVGRRVTTGRYVADADSRTITQSGAMATTSITGCADPASDMPERALPAADAAGLNTTYTYRLDSDTLILSTPRGTSITYTRL